VGGWWLEASRPYSSKSPWVDNCARERGGAGRGGGVENMRGGERVNKAEE
jgi:hypothetical protein